MSSMALLSSSELRGEESSGKALAVSSGPGGAPSSGCQGTQEAGALQQAGADFLEHLLSGLPGEEEAAGCRPFPA